MNRGALWCLSCIGKFTNNAIYVVCFIEILLAVLQSNVNFGLVNHLILLDVNFFENVEVLGQK